MKYFDYAATCPLDPDAAEMYLQAATNYYGNASSLHDIGDNSKNLLELCRDELAEVLGVQQSGIYFTSGGTESNLLGIESLVKGATKSGKHIITGIAEHASIHSSMKRLEREGFAITYLPFDSQGRIVVEQFREAITPDTILVSIQHANSEIGTLQPLEEISMVCKQANVLLHTDCVQSFGKVCLKNICSFVDSLSLSAHKVYGPKGVGALYINPKHSWKSLFPGATHERGLRPGTVNVPGIAAMLTALHNIEEQREKHNCHFKELRKALLESLSPIKDQITVHGSIDENQLASIIGLSVKGIEGQWLMLECNRYGYAISTGTACHTGMLSPSKTMLALGIEGKSAKEFVRISFGRSTTIQDAVDLGKTIVEVVRSLL